MRAIRLWLPIVLTVSLYGCGVNEIPRNDEYVKAAWSEVENQYQRRAELIPNLVEVVRKAGAYEQETLLLVTQARSGITSTPSPASVQDANGMRAYEEAQAGMTAALSKFILYVERYPDLKANRNYLTLLSQLEGTENRIAIARSRFIAAIAQYNTELRTFPGRLYQPVLYPDMVTIENYYKSTAANADVAPVVDL